MTETETDLRYPIGQPEWLSTLTETQRQEAIESLASTPARLRAAVLGLTPEQLDTPYRPDGWTVRQVVHHVPDSHMNAYVRFKLALTEDNPLIRLYKEDRWARLEDTRSTPIEVSLTLLEALHERWDRLLRSLTPEDFARPLTHPVRGPVTVDSFLGLYHWHGRHHVAHITRLRERMGWD
jgi:hypothetical protein